MKYNTLENIVRIVEAKKAKPDYLDFDGDGNEKEPMKKAIKDRKKQPVKEALIGKQHKIDVAAPYGKLTSQDFKQLRKGKGNPVKEGFSNWREDLSEVVSAIDKDKNDRKITEKKVNNKIKINPNIGEAIEELGGTLLEMIEIDEVDYIVESVYDELLEEGYDEDDIEEALEYALTEATVTYGHDTDGPVEKKKGTRHLVKAVGRLARQKLSSKVRGAKSAAASVIASGARKVAKGALGVARKMEGDKKPSTAHTKSRSASTYRGAGVGTKERVSSGSYTAPSKSASPKPKAQKIEDPWSGSATTPPKAKKQESIKTKTTTSKSQRKQLYRDILADVSGISDEERRRAAAKRKQTTGTTNEEYVVEKTLTSAETKEKERIVKSMKDRAADFEKRYPGRGKEVMYATATKMAKRIAESYIDEAKLPRSEKKSKKAEKLAGPKRPKHLVQLDLDQAALREVGKKRLKDPETGKKKTTKVEPAKINVKGSGGETVRTVSTGDFHKEKLGKGETMDFSPLRNPEKFKQTTKANKKVINKSRGAVVEPNTARGAFRSEEVSLSEDKGKVANKSIVQHLKNLGYNKKRGITMKAGHFTGDMPGSGSPGKKLIATKRDIEKYKPQKVSHIDDDPKNLEPLEKHRQETQGKKGKTRGSDPKIHTQHVGSYRKRGESRSEPREHGGVRRFSGVRDPGNITAPKTTKQIQRARKTARKGMGEAVEPIKSKDKQQNPSAINQVLQAKAKADAAEKELAIKQKNASHKGVNLSSISS
jgi:hypothetical protein